MPAGQPTKYKPEYCERVVDLGKEGKSRVQIAVTLEESRSVLDVWAEAHPKFLEALTRAKDCEQAVFEEKGFEALHDSGFNSSVWKTSMAARFKQDYTERKEIATKQTIILESDVDKL